MDPVLAYTQAHQSQIIGFIRQLVECESPSDDPAAVNRFQDLFADSVRDIAAKIKFVPGGTKFGKHLVIEFALPGRAKRGEGQILGLGHGDTVYPMGTLQSTPFRADEDKLWGPGVIDMKGGLAFFVFAMRALKDLQIPVSRKVVLQINSDEEVGSESSRALTEDLARKSRAVLVLEPGTGAEGKLKTSRKGVGDYAVVIRGKAAHAGVDFTAGASAILEAARQTLRIAEFTDLAKGTTVNPGVISGGTRTNVIADTALVEVDMRVAKLSEAAKLEKKFRALKPVDKRCTLEVTGGLNRPPMERTKGIVELLRLAQKLGKDIGVQVEESATGGGSDGNFTGALGIPTLDGIGAVGLGAHTPHEQLFVNRIADRTALLAKLVAAI
ncbi:peptidase M20 [Bryobacterales bacterium F-183]|nr:peptidase M20 [Bryobacterales bacterium F-183]